MRGSWEWLLFRATLNRLAGGRKRTYFHTRIGCRRFRERVVILCTSRARALCLMWRRQSARGGLRVGENSIGLL